MGDAAVGLAEAIDALRAELTLAMEAGRGHGMRFTAAPIELTIQTVVTKDVNGKIGWSVLGAGASYAASSTQTLKLTLTPVWERPDGTVTRDFLIADAAPEEVEPDRVGPRPPGAS